MVAAPVLARRLARYDIDGVIAEGAESGGHVGETTTMALVPQVVDAVDVPVIAAGGIADGVSLPLRLLWARWAPGGNMPAGERGVPHPREL